MTAGLPIDLAMVVAVALVVSVLLYLIRRERRETAAREMAVAELRESESKFRFIAENSGDVIWVMDIASWHNTYVSPSVYRLRGYTREEAMAQSVEAVMTPESLQRVKSILAEAIGRWEAGERTDAVRVVELDQPHKDGHLIATEVVATLHANAQGKLVSVLGVTRDITERKRTEQAIRQLAFHDPLTQLPNRRLLLDRLPQLISRAKREQSRLALLFIDLDRFKPINDEQGHEVGDWLLQSVAQRIQGCLRESDTAARIGGDEFVVLLPDLQADDDALAVAEKIRLALAQPFVTQDKVGLGVSSSIGVALYPDDGQTEQDLLRLTVTALTHPVDRAETSGAFESLLAGHSPARPAKVQFLHGDGHTMWVLLGVSLITDADKRPLHFVAQFLDVTAEKEAEARRGQFLSHVSHELRSPLAVVHQFASLLVDGVGGPLTPDQEEILVVLMRNVGQLRVMIDDLLEVTRADSGRLQVTCLPLALDDVLTEATAGYIWIAKNSRIGLFLEYGDLPTVLADSERIREIIANLLDNALRFTPGGGQVTVEAVPQGDFVCVTVRDTGRGIRPEHMDRIFERFFQVDQRDKESRSGLGLGLPICRELIERQGGLIWAISELGKGTAVSFTVPIVRDDATPPR